MKIIGIILALTGFIGGQVYLIYRLKRLDRHLEEGPDSMSGVTYDDSCRYPDEDVVE